MPSTINAEGAFDATVRNTVNANFLAPVTLSTPSTAGAAGVAGQICADTSYVYICVATNTWLRAAIATWS